MFSIQDVNIQEMKRIHKQKQKEKKKKEFLTNMIIHNGLQGIIV